MWSCDGASPACPGRAQVALQPSHRIWGMLRALTPSGQSCELSPELLMAGDGREGTRGGGEEMCREFFGLITLTAPPEEGTARLGSGSDARQQVTGGEDMASSCSRAGLGWTLGKNF